MRIHTSAYRPISRRGHGRAARGTVLRLGPRSLRASARHPPTAVRRCARAARVHDGQRRGRARGEQGQGTGARGGPGGRHPSHNALAGVRAAAARSHPAEALAVTLSLTLP